MSHYFWHNLFQSKDDPQQIITDYWAKTPLFQLIPKHQIASLVDNMHCRHFDKGETIFNEGDQGAGAILIQQGSVQISSKKVKLTTLSEGDFFGEIALAQTDKRTADAVAIEDSELVFLLKQDIEEWISYEPKHASQFLKNLAEVLALRLQKMNHIINKPIDYNG